MLIYFPESPSFTKTPNPVEGIKGKDASLHYEVYGTPPFQVNWYKDRRPLKESRKYKMVNEGNSATLHIVKLEQDDAGIYECRVSNNVGSESCRTTICLKGLYRTTCHFLNTLSKCEYFFSPLIFPSLFRTTSVCQEIGRPISEIRPAADTDSYG